MPHFIEIEEMLSRKEPLTQEEWLQILECVTDALRPIFKNTTFERLCDIRLGHPLSFHGRDKLFSSQEEAGNKIQWGYPEDFERGHTTEGVFFLTRGSENQPGQYESPIIGLTRNGRWVFGEVSWVLIQKDTRKIKTFWINRGSPEHFEELAHIKISELIEVLWGVLGNIIQRKKMQISDLEVAEREIGQIIQTTRRIPRPPIRT